MTPSICKNSIFLVKHFCIASLGVGVGYGVSSIVNNIIDIKILLKTKSIDYTRTNGNSCESIQ